MFGSAIIVLRESLEAALLIGIIAAATRSLQHRNRWLAAGIIAGLLGSLMVAGLTEHIAQWADGLGQEFFNAAILGIAVLMLGWHNIWMASHAREMVQEVKGVAGAVVRGERDLSAIALIIAVTVLREGSETVLFLYGMMASAPDKSGLISGSLLGLAGGLGIGLALYAGLLKIPVRWFFTVTSALLLLVAAGMAGQMAKFLIQADAIPALAWPLWDTSAFIPMDSAVGVFLHALLGYEAQPAEMQVIFYIVTFLTILVGMFLSRQMPAVKIAQSTS